MATDGQAQVETGKLHPETTTQQSREKPVVVSPQARQMGKDLADRLNNGLDPDRAAQMLARGDESPLKGGIVGAIRRPDGTLDLSRAAFHFDTQALAEMPNRKDQIARENDRTRSARYKDLPSAEPGTLDAVARGIQQATDINLKAIEDPEAPATLKTNKLRTLQELRTQRSLLDEVLEQKAAEIDAEFESKYGKSFIDINSRYYREDQERTYRQAEQMPASEARDRVYQIIDKLNANFPTDPNLVANHELKIAQAEALAIKLHNEAQKKIPTNEQPHEAERPVQQQVVEDKQELHNVPPPESAHSSQVEVETQPITSKPETPEDQLEREVAELAKLVHERGMGNLYGGMLANIDNVSRGYTAGRGFIMGEDIIPGQNPDYKKLFDVLSADHNIPREVLNPHTENQHVWVSRDYDPIRRWRSERIIEEGGRFRKKQTTVYEDHQEYRSFQGRHGESDWRRLQYFMPCKDEIGRMGTFAMNLVVSPDVAQKLDQAVAGNPLIPDRLLKTLFPGVIGLDATKSIKRERATELMVAKFGENMQLESSYVAQLPRPIEY